MSMYDEQVQRARAAYAQALAAETKARIALRTARGELFAALRGRQADRIANAGDVEQVPVPCPACVREVAPYGDERHEIVVEGAGLPYARCDLAG